MATSHEHIQALLAARLEGRARTFLDEATTEITGGTDINGFASRIAVASRYTPRVALSPTDAERAEAERILPGWNLERWTLLETVRVALVLARPDLDQDAGIDALEETFQYADEGELCALYRSLAHLPSPERFAWRGGEGCRTNMVSVFEAVACDTPYPAQYFDDIAWRQLVIKALFVEAPLWRVHGLDGRLDEELARMALDLTDERRSAGRKIQPELWITIGSHHPERALESIERELASDHVAGRRAGALALARAGRTERLKELASAESDPLVAETMRSALAGTFDQTAFASLEPSLQETP